MGTKGTQNPVTITPMRKRMMMVVVVVLSIMLKAIDKKPSDSCQSYYLLKVRTS